MQLRKPATGLIEEAVREFIRKKDSYMIGDTTSDNADRNKRGTENNISSAGENGKDGK